jgi:hypothetical protein
VRERRRGRGDDAPNAVLVAHLDRAELLEVAGDRRLGGGDPLGLQDRVTNWAAVEILSRSISSPNAVLALGLGHELSSLIQRKTPIIAERR